MDRVLVEQWLLTIRRSALPRQNQNDGSSNDLDLYRTTVREIVPASKQDEILATIDFYSGLAAYNSGRVPEASQMIESSKSKLFGTKKKKINLADLGALTAAPSGENQPSTSAPQESDDQAFVRLLQSVVTDDSTSGR